MEARTSNSLRRSFTQMKTRKTLGLSQLRQRPLQNREAILLRKRSRFRGLRKILIMWTSKTIHPSNLVKAVLFSVREIWMELQKLRLTKQRKRSASNLLETVVSTMLKEISIISNRQVTVHHFWLQRTRRTQNLSQTSKFCLQAPPHIPMPCSLINRDYKTSFWIQRKSPHQTPTCSSITTWQVDRPRLACELSNRCIRIAPEQSLHLPPQIALANSVDTFRAVVRQSYSY